MKHNIVIQVDESITIDNVKSALQSEGINYEDIDIITNDELVKISRALVIARLVAF